MSKKLGRNKPCWCGTGKKYKKCHLNRHEEKPIPKWEVEKRYRDTFSAKFCSCPDSMKNECSGKIIRAHTVSKSSSLKQIAQNGHVYGFVPTLDNISRNNGVIFPELIGINRASTFTGFCGAHDKSLFTKLEDEEFSSTPEQIFLVGYRALAREYFTKMAQNDFQDIYKEVDKGKAEDEQYRIQTMAFLHSVVVFAGVRDVQIHKERFDQVLLGYNFDEVRGYVIEFSDVVPILCSGAIYPEIDFEGNRFQDLSDLEATLDNMCFSLFVSNGRGYAVFTWLSDSDTACEKFINSLSNISDELVFSALTRFSFQSFENVFISPEWWDIQPEEIKKEIIARLASGTNLIIEVNDDCLKDNGVNYGSYNVIVRRKINASNNTIKFASDLNN